MMLITHVLIRHLRSQGIQFSYIFLSSHATLHALFETPLSSASVTQTQLLTMQPNALLLEGSGAAPDLFRAHGGYPSSPHSSLLHDLRCDEQVHGCVEERVVECGK